MKVEPSQITLLAPVLTTVTPAVAQLVIFAATLFFALVWQAEFRGQIASLFASRDAKLRYLRIANAIEVNLGWFKKRGIKPGAKIEGLERAGPAQ